MSAVLRLAKEAAIDANDWVSVWSALVEMAKSANKPPPLLGYVESEGVQYQNDSDEEPVKYFKREACRKRLTRGR